MSLSFRYNLDMMDLLLLQAFLEKECSFSREIPLILGVSGGADSLSLMHILNDFGYSIVVGHLDHSIRPESTEEAETVRDMAQAMSLTTVIEKVKVLEEAEKLGLNLEDASRKARYRFLFKLAEQKNAQAVVVAHHADDQAETILMNLIRGAGLTGLKGMQSISQNSKWSDEIPLVRPLLSIWKAEIERYCLERKIVFLEDPSNKDSRFLRNRIRNEIIPLLETSNPKFKKSLMQTADIWEADDNLLTVLTDSAWEDCLITQDAHLLAFSREKFTKLPLSIRRRIIRKVGFTLLEKTEAITYMAIKTAIDFISNTRMNANIEWLDSQMIRVEKDSIYFQSGKADIPVKGPQIQQGWKFEPTQSNKISMDDGWIFEVRINQRNGIGNEIISSEEDQYSIKCDLSGYAALQLRTRKSGDRIQPLGMKTGRVKISDFMINEKLPKRARDQWPLLAHGEEILWVPGYRMSEKIRIKKETININLLSIKQS